MTRTINQKMRAFLPQQFFEVVSEEKPKITDFFPDITVFSDQKTRVAN